MNAEPASIHDFPSGETFQERQYIIRFKRVKALGTKYREARAAHIAWWKEHAGLKRAAHGTELWIREELEVTQLAAIENATGDSYRAACDEFFFGEPRTGEGEAG